MITRIFSDLETFKPLTFRAGLNILVAERHEDATARDTRNGTGKTSVIELLHFLVQDRKSPDDDFHKAELVGSTFGASFLDEGRKYDIERRANPGKEKDQAFFSSEPIDARELRQRLALDWFGLSAEELAEPYGPKFGALLAYFIRKERNGGFASPALNASVQQPWDSQVNLAYLLGLGHKLINGIPKWREV